MRISATIALFILLAAGLAAGCAELGIRSEEELVDPIAAAALAVRSGKARAADTYVRGPASEADVQAHQERLRSALTEREIIPGMDMRQVRAIMGEPYDIETAGDTGAGNQRWTYPLGITGRLGLGGQRTLYFENGHLAGWENR